MKKLSLLLACVMLIGIALPTLAEEPAPSVKDFEKPFEVNVQRVEASEGQAELEAHTKAIIEVDGLKFKDLNGNGELDVYEDWRQDIDARAADLVSQMTLEEKLALMIHCNTAGAYTGTYPATWEYLYAQDCPFPVPDLGRWDTASGYSCWYYINVFGISHFLDNTNGTAAEQIEVHNAIQEISENTRLGVPMTFSCDRFYNGWGGWTDDPHDAFGTANDPELSKKIWTAYMKEMRAIGYHLLLHPYSVELGAFYGENPEYVAKMAALEIKTIEENGMEACAKHWIARGGDASFAAARSVAQNVDNWMEPWKAAIDAGTSYIMCSTISGLSNSGSVVFDKASMDYLRDTLGYDGVVLTDWTQIAAWGVSCTGVTPEGVDLSTLSLKELYGLMFSNNVDQIGNVSVMHGDDYTNYFMSSAYPDAMKDAVTEGLLSEESVNASATRILKAKFKLGLFENPYCDAEAAMKLVASDEYLAAPFAIDGPDALAAARNPELVALERQLQAESTVLVKNDDALLPLAEGTKVFFTSTNDTNKVNYAAALQEVFTLTETLEEADVVVIDATALNDSTEMAVEDAKAAGKRIVVAANCVDPNAFVMANADAVLFLNYKTTPDHGSALPGFNFYMEPVVFAQLLTGKVEPTGMIVKEIARDPYIDSVQWKDLAGDQGASPYVRMLVLGLMQDSPDHSTPDNFGDPLLPYRFGMRYGANSDLQLSVLVTPVTTAESVNAYGRTVISTVPASVKSGEPFTLYCMLRNNGDAGLLNVQAKDGETVIGEKIMAVNANSWRVVELPVTLEGAGEHTVTVGDLTATITVE